MYPIVKKESMACRLLKSVAHNGPIKKAELGRRLDMQKSNVTKVLATLSSQRLVSELVTGDVRSPLVMSDVHYSLSFEVSELYVRHSRVFLNNRVSPINEQRLDCSSIEELSEYISMVIGSEDTNSEMFMGVTIAVPALVNRLTGNVLYSARLQWSNENLVQKVHERCGIHCLIDNSTHCLLRMRNWCNLDSIRDATAMLFSIDEGVGCSISIQGEVLEGSNYLVGEIGHIPAGFEKRQCKCGKQDCLQMYCSYSALLSEVKELVCCTGIESLTDLKDVSNSMRIANNIFQHRAEEFARLIIPSVSLLGPQQIIFCCGDPVAVELFSSFVNRFLGNYYASSASSAPRVIFFHNRSESILLGAASLSFEQAFSVIF